MLAIVDGSGGQLLGAGVDGDGELSELLLALMLYTGFLTCIGRGLGGGADPWFFQVTAWLWPVQTGGRLWHGTQVVDTTWEVGADLGGRGAVLGGAGFAPYKGSRSCFSQFCNY